MPCGSEVRFEGFAQDIGYCEVLLAQPPLQFLRKDPTSDVEMVQGFTNNGGLVDLFHYCTNGMKETNLNVSLRPKCSIHLVAFTFARYAR